MLKKIGSILFRNLGLKIGALVIAVILWFIIVNVNDPDITRSFSCAVTIENAEALAEQGKTFEVVDGSTAYFNVRAPRSIMRNLSEADFRAVADMSNVQDYTTVPITVTAIRYSGQTEITKITKYLEIVTENLQSGQYIVTAEQSGEPAEGYAVGNLSVSPNVLKVSGPMSIVSEIDRVVATINVDDVASDISDSVIPQLFDRRGRAIDTTRLTLNLTSVIVRAEIYGIKEVGMTVTPLGDPAEGYELKDVIFEPDAVRIMGDTADLNTFSQITIPSEVLDITDATDDVSVTVDISAYLPDGITLVDTMEKDVDIAAIIEPAEDTGEEDAGNTE